MDMDMPGMTMSSTSTMPMASATGHSMSGMSDMSSMSMSMADMKMTFFTSFKTPLFADDWTPASKGHYAGTCIFLIVLAVILRVLIALRPILEGRVWTDGVRHGEDLHAALHTHQKPYVSGWRLSLQELGNRWSRWRVNPAAGRATYELLLAGVAYLL